MIDSTKIRKDMGVIAADGRQIGVVRSVEADKLCLTSVSGGHGYDHLVPLAWVMQVDRYVYLDRASRSVADNWENAAARSVRRLSVNELVELAKPAATADAGLERPKAA